MRLLSLNSNSTWMSASRCVLMPRLRIAALKHSYSSDTNAALIANLLWAWIWLMFSVWCAYMLSIMKWKLRLSVSACFEYQCLWVCTLYHVWNPCLFHMCAAVSCGKMLYPFFTPLPYLLKWACPGCWMCSCWDRSSSRLHVNVMFSSCIFSLSHLGEETGKKAVFWLAVLRWAHCHHHHQCDCSSSHACFIRALVLHSATWDQPPYIHKHDRMLADFDLNI